MRCGLAAACRLTAPHDWTDLDSPRTAPAFSARAPGVEGEFLLNPSDLFYEAITARALMDPERDGVRCSPPRTTPR